MRFFNHESVAHDDSVLWMMRYDCLDNDYVHDAQLAAVVTLCTDAVDVSNQVFLRHEYTQQTVLVLAACGLMILSVLSSLACIWFFIYLCIHVCIYIYLAVHYSCVCICICIYIHIYMYIIRIYICTCIYIYIYTYTYIYIYIYIHTYIYIYVYLKIHRCILIYIER